MRRVYTIGHGNTWEYVDTLISTVYSFIETREYDLIIEENMENLFLFWQHFDGSFSVKRGICEDI